MNRILGSVPPEPPSSPPTTPTTAATNPTPSNIELLLAHLRRDFWQDSQLLGHFDHLFSVERLQRVDSLIEASQHTALSHCSCCSFNRTIHSATQHSLRRLSQLDKFTKPQCEGGSRSWLKAPVRRGSVQRKTQLPAVYTPPGCWVLRFGKALGSSIDVRVVAKHHLYQFLVLRQNLE